MTLIVLMNYASDFYRGLYDVIKLLGPQHHKANVLTMNLYEEHEDIIFFGDWPFVAQHIFYGKDEGEKIVLGVLSLDGTQPFLS